MKVFYSLLLTCVLPVVTMTATVDTKNHSADYQLIHSNDTLFFGKELAEVLSLRVTHCEMDGEDSIFYFPGNLFRIYDAMDAYEVYSGKSSWLGTKVKIKPDGINLLFTHEDEEVLLKTQALPDESWLAYQSESNGLKAIGTVTAIEEEEILGLKDLVKTITLQIFNREDAPVSTYALAISKQYGLIRTPQMCLFPDFETHYLTPLFYNSQETVELLGTSTPKRGVSNLTWKEVHDYAPGDEIHTYFNHEYVGSVPEESVIINRKTIRNCLEFIGETDNSVTYRFEVLEDYKSMEYGHATDKVTCDTVVRTYTSVPFFDRLPGEIALIQENDYNTHIETWCMYLDHGGFKTSFSNFIYQHPDNKNLFLNNTMDDFNRSVRYYRGLGKLDDAHFSTETFVYYKKGGQVTWGSPLEINSLSHISGETSRILIENRRISIDSPYSDYPLVVEVFTSEGIALIKGKIYSSDEKLPVPGKYKGAVIVHAVSNSGKFSSAKGMVLTD